MAPNTSRMPSRARQRIADRPVAGLQPAGRAPCGPPVCRTGGRSCNQQMIHGRRRFRNLGRPRDGRLPAVASIRARSRKDERPVLRRRPTGWATAWTTGWASGCDDPGRPGATTGCDDRGGDRAAHHPPARRCRYRRQRDRELDKPANGVDPSPRARRCPSVRPRCAPRQDHEASAGPVSGPSAFRPRRDAASTRTTIARPRRKG